MFNHAVAAEAAREVPEDRFDHATELSYRSMFPLESPPWNAAGNVHNKRGVVASNSGRRRVPRSSLLRVDTVTQEVSDHFPQVYWVHPSIPVMTWNVMTRARFDRFREHRNNAFSKNENIEEYARRILGPALHVVREFFLQYPSTAVCCLQEFSTNHLLREEFVAKLQQSLPERTIRFEFAALTHSLGNVVVWDERVFKGARVTDLPLERTACVDLWPPLRRADLAPTRICNCHLVWRASPGDPRYRTHLEEIAKAVRHLWSRAPPGLCVVVGDFNVDLKDLDVESHGLIHIESGSSISLEKTRHPSPDGMAVRVQRIPGSSVISMMDGAQRPATNDGCISGQTLAYDHPVTQADVITNPIDGYLRESGQEMYFGKSREQFIAQHIAFSIQDAASTLTDEELDVLGRLSFRDQPSKLSMIIRAAR
ncbi:hypothetical protein FOZ60_016531 [Perkinsus olseni]|uniref:Endonuclease/exonuclease/phosphatase domain-containing protein n=2 Tax=Perkinsus olseni TaxID=32597 RepID=A0A7J6T0R8_PEROL|nr:hypothetical protein FOZ60_016531 [Perkinsus olseni]KAF4738829.1 hypothetical protein FOZ62_020381 [Perkinsus olseni]